MEQLFLSYAPPAPFVPGTIDFAKKKARQLQELVEGLPLSYGQQLVARALGWNDWFALERALASRDRVPSGSDESVGVEEARRRWTRQFGELMLGLTLQQVHAQGLTARLGLTCTAATTKARINEIGPWGAFFHKPREIAPGILLGRVPGAFECYKLSKARTAVMPISLRGPDDWGGWFLEIEEGWRVVLSFPEAFDTTEVSEAWKTLAGRDAVLHERVLAELSAR